MSDYGLLLSCQLKLTVCFETLSEVTAYPRWNITYFIQSSSQSSTGIWPVSHVEFMGSSDSSVSQIYANYIHVNPCACPVYFSISFGHHKTSLCWIVVFLFVKCSGGSRGCRRPPKGPDSFVLTYNFFETEPPRELAPPPPPWEILDPPLKWSCTLKANSSIYLEDNRPSSYKMVIASSDKVLN